jgi:hypothetical protein
VQKLVILAPWLQDSMDNSIVMNTSVACALDPSVTVVSTDFFGIFWHFSGRNYLKIQYLPPSESKSYQINSIKSCSSRSFQQTKGTFQFLRNFQLWFNLIFVEEIIQYSRTSLPQVQMPWNQANAPLFLESFPKRLRNTIWSIPVGWISSVQTKQTN